MSVMSQCYSVIIDRGISASGNGKEVVDGINAVDKGYIYQLMSNVQLPGSNIFDSQMKIHIGNLFSIPGCTYALINNNWVTLRHNLHKVHSKGKSILFGTTISVYHIVLNVIDMCNTYQWHWVHLQPLCHSQVHLCLDQ